MSFADAVHSGSDQRANRCSLVRVSVPGMNCWLFHYEPPAAWSTLGPMSRIVQDRVDVDPV